MKVPKQISTSLAHGTFVVLLFLTTSEPAEHSCLGVQGISCKDQDYFSTVDLL